MSRAALVPVVAGLLGFACTNDPYPGADQDRKIFYTHYREAPRTLDPAVAYTTGEHRITGNVYDTLLEYHYLKRPYTLIPALARKVPVGRHTGEGQVVYRFELRPDLVFQEDACFEAHQEGMRTRPVLAADVAFELQRIADPAVNSPVTEPFSNLVGFRAFSEALVARREADPGFAALPVHEQYAALGGIDGARVVDETTLEIVLAAPYPQILYWFAMPFTTPVPWEAVAYYDGEEGRAHFKDHPVGTGPYRLAVYDKHDRMILEKSDAWYGVRHPEWRAPGASFPTEGAPGDLEAGRIPPRLAGRPLPFVERVEFRREKESIPAFHKFLQGYYDAAGVIRESFDKVIREDRLSPEMEALGIRLEKSVIPSVYYLGFNMDDAVVGRAGAARARKLRQAMSLVINAEEYARLFNNGRGIPAQSPLPSGIFGYDPGYRNPYRQVDLARARELLAEAGYADGLDPETGKPLRLTFDTYDTSAQGLLRYQFFVQAWRKLGLDVEVAATNYNQFQEKVRNGAYQLFQWGWVADYPDPENFFFLLWSEMARSKSGGPNTSNFADPRFDELFLTMKAMENGPERLRVIQEMRGIVERESPWVPLLHPEDYALYHGWLVGLKPAGLSFPTTKYRDIDPAARAASRLAWNRPVVWPAYALLGVGTALLIPGILTFLRERQ
ncbi:MAG: ABC transporter substrate-binding protein [Myxococcota bacterium]